VTGCGRAPASDPWDATFARKDRRREVHAGVRQRAHRRRELLYRRDDRGRDRLGGAGAVTTGAASPVRRPTVWPPPARPARAKEPRRRMRRTGSPGTIEAATKAPGDGASGTFGGPVSTAASAPVSTICNRMRSPVEAGDTHLQCIARTHGRRQRCGGRGDPAISSRIGEPVRRQDARGDDDVLDQQSAQRLRVGGELGQLGVDQRRQIRISGRDRAERIDAHQAVKSIRCGGSSRPAASSTADSKALRGWPSCGSYMSPFDCRSALGSMRFPRASPVSLTRSSRS